ncbi:MAG: TrbC/VirB2 family protein [Minisyncoccales bacterium]
MKNNLFFIPFFLFLLINFVFAQDLPLVAEICNIIKWLKNVILVILILLIIFYGYQMMAAGGDPGKTEGAKKGIIFALIGAAVVLTAVSIVKMVSSQIPACSNL